MKAVRGPRALALAVAFALGLAGAGIAASPAVALGDPAIDDLPVHVDLDTVGNSLGSVVVEVVDAITMTPLGSGTTDASGDVVIADIDETTSTEFWVVAYGGALGYTNGTVVAAHSGAGWDLAEIVVFSEHVTLSGVVRHGGSGLPFEDAWVIAEIPGGLSFFPSYQPTPSDGSWSIDVPRGFQYQLYAETLDDSAIPQYWDHAPLDLLGAGCGCSSGDLIDVPAAAPGAATPAGPYRFDLWNPDTSFLIEIYAGDIISSNPVEDMRFQLWKRVGGVWKKTDARTTNADGLVDLFANGAGRYKLTYTYNGVAYEALFVLSASSRPVTVSPDGCSVDLATITPVAGAFNADLVIVGFDGTSPAACAGSPNTPKAPKPPTRTASSPVVLATPTPTPTPTPTSTPTPSSSPSTPPSPEPSATATPDPEPATASADLWWLWVLIVLVLLGGVVLIVLVRRR